MFKSTFVRGCRRLWLGLAALLAGLTAHAGSWHFDYSANLWGVREFQAWIPASYRPGTPMPAVLAIHGCVSEPNSMAAITRYNELAEREGFIVIYPRQNVTANPPRCWNFMLPQNQVRGAGEPSILVGMVSKMRRTYNIDASRVYVTGISSGGAMTATLAACYSDVFAAAAIHAGAMYKSGESLLTSAESMLLGSPFDPNARGVDAWKCSGSPRRLMPVLVFHGTSDIVVNPVNGEQAVQQFVQTNDLGDDGLDNDSARYQPASITSHVAPVPNGLPYTVATYRNSAGSVVAQKVTVQGMNHAWSGGPPLLPFSEERGPDSTGISWQFFRNYRR